MGPSPRLENARPDQIHQAVADGWPLLVPAGCLECHGRHLPVGCDAIIAEELALAAAAELPALVAPILHYGPTGYAVSGPDLGTMDMSAGVFGAHAKAVLAGLCRLGFARIIVIIHHQGVDGPEGLALRLAAGEVGFARGLEAGGEGWWSGPRSGELTVEFGRITVLPSVLPEAAATVRGDHAGAVETSLMLHLRPESCDMSRLDPDEFHYLKTAPAGTAGQARSCSARWWTRWSATCARSGAIHRARLSTCLPPPPTPQSPSGSPPSHRAAAHPRCS